MNMIDGLDGLCGGIVVIMLGWLIFATLQQGGHVLILPMFILATALMAFLVYNLRYAGHKSASVFLGDAGSASLGLTLSWLVIELTQWPSEIEPGVLPPVTVAWFLAYPVFDALSLFAYRLKNKRHPFSPDRRHLHYLLRDAGLSVRKTVALIHAIVFVYCAIGVAGPLCGIAPVFLMMLWIALFFIHGCIIFGLIRPRTLPKR
jgi:UDP-GlcNAc:undecaprenyl-phosphate GlcNAc-1-phosphate transferase